LLKVCNLKTWEHAVADQTIDRHHSGAFAPLRSEDDFELEVVGRIPDSLAGAYYRNGPNPQFDPQGPRTSHSSATA
jgi:carotenoid cleavage dioxygenase-like enzyme